MLVTPGSERINAQIDLIALIHITSSPKESIKDYSIFEM